MSSTHFYRFPWAVSGDKTPVPDVAPGSGAVSYPQGFGPDYERDPTLDPLAKRVPRDETNQYLFDITSNLRAWQIGGSPEWVTAAQNGGVAVTYPIASIVRHDQSGAFVNYVARVETSDEPGTSTDWAEIGPAAKSLFNMQQTALGVRTVLTSIVGFTNVLSAAFVKSSPTSNIVFFLSSPSFVPGAAGPAIARLTVGGTAVSGVMANNDPAAVKGQTNFNGIITGLPAGSNAWTYAIGRFDATVWGGTVNPNSTDNGYLPAAGTQTTLLIGEIEP